MNDDDGDETLHGSLLSVRLWYCICHDTAARSTARFVIHCYERGVREK